jgi:hypothetical protein
MEGTMVEKVMTAKERLLHLLFGREKVTHRNIKFMRGHKPGVTEEEFCSAVNAALVERRAGILTPVSELPRAGAKVDVKKYVDAL